MVTRILVYKNGHFYDRTTGDRLEIKDGIEFSITCKDHGDFFIASPAGNPTLKPLSSAAVLKEIKADREITKHKKLFDAGKHLFFYINRVTEERIFSHVFEVELLEDLYLIFKSGWKLQEYRLYDCACLLVDSPSGFIEFFESVHGKSLNELYKNTFVHYFGNVGNPASNALDRFYELKKGKPVYISSYRDNPVEKPTKKETGKSQTITF
jgi:hypothetical protein